MPSDPVAFEDSHARHNVYLSPIAISERNPSYWGRMVRIGSRKWTPAQVIHLVALIDEGSSATAVAVSLKRSVTVIRTRARRLGKPFPKVPLQS
jgi:hypothetical protein